jgi:hypothetical protein
VPISAWSECLRHLDRARINARRCAIFVSGVAVVCGSSIVVLQTLPWIPAVALVAGGAVVAFYLSRKLALATGQDKAVAVLRKQLTAVLSVDPAVQDVVHLVEGGGTIVGQFKLTTTADDGAVLVWSQDLDTAAYRTEYGPIGNTPF